jgi:hypothetical protein
VKKIAAVIKSYQSRFKKESQKKLTQQQCKEALKGLVKHIALTEHRHPMDVLDEIDYYLARRREQRQARDN